VLVLARIGIESSHLVNLVNLGNMRPEGEILSKKQGIPLYEESVKPRTVLVFDRIGIESSHLVDLVRKTPHPSRIIPPSRQKKKNEEQPCSTDTHADRR
jgi:hypothetical protein